MDRGQNMTTDSRDRRKLSVLVFLVIVLSVWVAEHVYVGWRVLSLGWLAGGPARWGAIAVLVIGMLAYPVGRSLYHTQWKGIATVVEYLGACWMGTVFLCFCFLLVAQALTLGGTILQRYVAFIDNGAVAVALVASLAAWVGGQVRPRVVELELEVPGLEAQSDGLVLCQLSDLHLGTLVGVAALQDTIEHINELQPDVILITGDLVDASFEAVEPMLDQLKRLRAPRGVLIVAGNHEYYAGIDRCRRLFTEAGYTFLENTTVEVSPGVFIAGVPDLRGSRQLGRTGPDLTAAVAGVPERDRALVLLQHAPHDEERAAAAGVDLLLNGHTHGGQIWPFHYLVRCDWAHLAGVYEIGGLTQVVSRGAGHWGPPMRLFAPADLVRVTLRSRPAATIHDQAVTNLQRQ